MHSDTTANEIGVIENQRDAFAIPAGLTYLNCAYLSPMLRASALAGEAGLERKLHPWKIVRRDFFEEVEEARSLFAQLINASADDIALVPAASYAAAVAGLNLPLRNGQSVIVVEQEHFSNVYQWIIRAREAHAGLITVSAPAGGSWAEAIVDRIDQRTAIVAIPLHHWHDGRVVDMDVVTQAVRAVGATLVIDGTQSIGAVPFDVQRHKPAFLLCAAYKWLLGPYGFGFLYADSRYHKGTPLEHHSYNRAGAAEIQSTSGYSDTFMAGARRYDQGERSNFISLPIVITALRQILRWEPRRIALTLAPLIELINRRGADLGLMSPAPDECAPHFTGLRLAAGFPSELPAELAAAGVHIAVRGEALRVSPYLYNSTADVDRLFEQLVRFLR